MPKRRGGWVEDLRAALVARDRCVKSKVESLAAARSVVSTAPDEQRRRILSRNGPERLRLFEERWIPYEKKYEAAFGIREKADFIILT